MYVSATNRHTKSRIKRDKVLYRWLMINGGGSFDDGIKAYSEAVCMAKDTVSRIYFHLVSNRRFAKFYRETDCRRLYRNYKSFVTAVSNIISTNHEKRMRFDRYCVLKKIIKMYRVWSLKK
ncbi:MAG: hypothetical protein ABXS91_08695 [Sulfurimonas sp.]